MVFSADITVMGIEIVEPQDENGDPVEGPITMALVVGLPLPGLPQPLPLGLLKVNLGKDAATRYGQQLMDAGRRLPEPPKESDLVVVTNPQAVEQVAKAAQATENFKK